VIRKRIKNASAVVLPGVGAYRDAFKNLEEMDLIKPIYESIKNKPFLGICMGMQLLFEYSLEGGKNKGLGVFKGFVGRIPPGVKIPHIGWNQIEIKKKSKLLKDIKQGENFYFVHSYYPEPEREESIIATTDYGIRFASVIGRDNVVAVQFHPEKSGRHGLQALKIFVNGMVTYNPNPDKLEIRYSDLSFARTYQP